MSAYRDLLEKLRSAPRKWLVTGAAGFIGSNLVEALLLNGQTVSGLDNFSSGYEKNIDLALAAAKDAAKDFRFIRGDIRDAAVCREACAGVDFVLHQAALGSVPRSLDDPATSNASNVDGFLNVLLAARDAGVKNFVYASSSSIYGDETTLPNVEERIGRALSPYAVSKHVNELYAGVFAEAYGFRSIGLRYFNVFGQRQDPFGAYPTVIPLWFAALLRGGTVYINGDGETSRDFCFIDNCVQANILAACCSDPGALDQVYNISYGQQTTLNELFALIREEVTEQAPAAATVRPVYRDFRPGDVRHTRADIGKAQRLLGYAPEFDIRAGLRKAGVWYAANCA
ncbi:MAG: SDR family oxidoreductase [Desulfovibrio sp.]|jgi:UDP-N-acetylglucosamine 4-epimerase|nr:SDR family oxidoreductase [Desulfovibrio sp.]